MCMCLQHEAKSTLNCCIQLALPGVQQGLISCIVLLGQAGAEAVHKDAAETAEGNALTNHSI